MIDNNENEDNENINAIRTNDIQTTDQSLNEKNSGYEKALSLIGFGKFHLILLFVCGLANSSDAIEILCVSFVLPSAQCDLNMSTNDKGYLSSMTFIGMLIGGYFWGTLADVCGRKYVLASALFFNAFFAILAGVSQSFSVLLLFRFLSGLGVGGSVPIVWSYFSEFIPKDIRGRMICCLASSWFFGNLLVILFAYVILNELTIDINLFSGKIIINNWRMFMIVSALPSAITGILVLFLPESPKFCLYNCNELEAKKILQKIYNFNYGKKMTDHKKIVFEHLDTFKISSKYSLSDDDFDYRLDDRAPLYYNPNQSKIKYYLATTKKYLKDIFKKTISLFQKPYSLNTILILFIMFALCLGYYGLWIWLPELYKRMAVSGGSPCSAANIKINTSSINNTKECHIQNSVYLSSLYSSLSNLPGNIFTIIFIDKMGRNLVTSLSLIASGVAIFGIPFITSESQGVILTTIFGGINVLTFNSFGCTSTELYPTKLRSSALGVQYVAGRLGAILGNMLFGFLVDVSCYVPLLTISALLIISGILSCKLPESNKMEID